MALKMRILCIAKDTFPPFRVDVTVLFARELAERGYVSDWILQSAQHCDGEFETRWGGGTAWVGPSDSGHTRLRRLRKHWLGLRHDLRVLRIAKLHRYDVVQVKDKVVSALPALWAARRSGAAFTYWLSFPFAESSTYLARIGRARYPLLYRLRGWALFHLLYRFILPRTDHVFVQSEQMKTDLASYGLEPAKMTAVPMGVDMRDFAGMSASVAPVSQHRRPTVAYLGTLAGERRIDFVVRCVALVRKSIPDIRLLLVGDGDRPGDADQIRAEARKFGIEDRVEITGLLPRPEALRRIVEASVCVSPFYPTPILNSTSPTKLIEYMALGLPVVANDHPEQKLVLTESRAGMCVPYEEAAFAEAIVQILRDPQEAAAMGRRGRDYVASHRDYGSIATLVAREYEKLLARPVRTASP